LRALTVEAGSTGTPAQAAHKTQTLLAYGGPALPINLAALPILAYLPAFYAQELHLKPALVGIVFLCARLWDALSNLLVGWLSDRSMSRFGRRKPWVILGTPFLMASTWFLCHPPRGTGLAYLAVWATLFYASWAAMYVPYLSWGTELASDYAERNRVTSFREAFTMLGVLFFSAGPLVFLNDDAPLREVLYLISLTVLLTLPLTILPLAFSVRDPAPTQRMQTHLLEELTEVARDRVMRRFALATLCFATGEGIANSLLVFFFSVGLALPNKMFWAIFILYVATLCSVPLMLRLTRHVEKHRLLAAGVAVQMLVYAGAVFIPQGNFTLVAVLWIVLGMANSAMLILPTSIVADIIDHGEAVSGERRSGAYVAVFNLMFKLGMALGVGVAFGLLALIEYRPDAATHTAADALHIRLLTFGLPGLLAPLVVFLYLKHPITQKVQRQLRAQITMRREGAAS
jgi:glycoside/pentoside/hexuronide:cation symporter, GPH family